MIDNDVLKSMIDESIKVRECAYSPYSKFKVGASVLFENNKIYSGCNIENASFGATNCAERTAIFKAVSEGMKFVKAVCVVGSFEEFTYPCGICRQVIIEFAENENIPIIVAKNRESFEVHKLKDINPFGFSKKDLI